MAVHVSTVVRRSDLCCDCHACRYTALTLLELVDSFHALTAALHARRQTPEARRQVRWAVRAFLDCQLKFEDEGRASKETNVPDMWGRGNYAALLVLEEQFRETGSGLHPDNDDLLFESFAKVIKKAFQSGSRAKKGALGRYRRALIAIIKKLFAKDFGWLASESTEFDFDSDSESSGDSDDADDADTVPITPRPTRLPRQKVKRLLYDETVLHSDFEEGRELSIVGLRTSGQSSRHITWGAAVRATAVGQEARWIPLRVLPPTTTPAAINTRERWMCYHVFERGSLESLPLHQGAQEFAVLFPRPPEHGGGFYLQTEERQTLNIDGDLVSPAELLFQDK